jgi:hypothetical protein
MPERARKHEEEKKPAIMRDPIKAGSGSGGRKNEECRMQNEAAVATIPGK